MSVIGTAPHIESVALATSSAVRSVRVRTTEPGRFEIAISMAWWSWLAIGLLHRRVRHTLRATEHVWKAAGTMAEIRFGGRGR